MDINLDPETVYPVDNSATRERKILNARIPFLNQPIGAGDAVKRLTRAFGIEPCSPCEERAKKMNEKVRFVPVGWV